MVRAAFQRWHERMVHGDDWIDSFAYLFDIAHPPDVGALRDARRERQAWALQDRLEQLDTRSRREAIRIQQGMQIPGYQEELEDMFYAA